MTTVPNAEPVPRLEASMILAKDILAHLKALARGRLRRDEAQVDVEYNSGVWKATLDGKAWLRRKDLMEYLTSTEEQMGVRKVGNRLVRMRERDYYALRTRIIQDLLTEYAGGEPEVVELGCGCGYNLFTLALTGRWRRLLGFDVSEHAVRAGREAAEHFGVPNVSFGTLDLRDGRSPNFPELRGRTAFTYYCLEQLKYSTAAVIENLLAAGVRRVVHIETSYELLRMGSLMDWATYLYVRRMDYQDNLLKTLRAFEKKGALRVVDAKRLYYSPGHRNDPTLICWESAAAAPAAAHG